MSHEASHPQGPTRPHEPRPEASGGDQVTPAAHSTASPGYHESKDAFLKRMRRIEGQVRGIERMIEQDVYCIDILTQVSAATKALQAVALGLVEEHMSHCVLQAAQQGGEEAQVKLREASDAIARLVRS